MDQPSVFMIPLASRMHRHRSVEPSKLARELLEDAGLKVFGRVEPAMKVDDVPKFPVEEYDAVIVFIASGGTSEMAAKVAKDAPYFIWAYDETNSLASALSVREKLKRIDAWRGQIVYNSLDEAPSEVVSFAKASRLLKSVRGIKLGVICDEQYFSGIQDDGRRLQDLLGINVVQVADEELLNELGKVGEEEAAKVVDKFSSATVVEPSKKEILKASKMYLALRTIVKKYGLDALTLDCFKALKRTGASTCMAFSLLNDDGKVAVCEGDLKATMLMLIFQRLSGSSWMGNLVQVSSDLNVATFAHCTAATTLAEPGGTIILRSHFESGESVSLDVPLKRQRVTVANLQFQPFQLIVARGEVIESQVGKFSLCRTQVKVKLSGDVGKLLQYTGNHHVLAYGDWVDTLRCVAKNLGMPMLEI